MCGALKEKNCYKRYRELGGIINEKDYKSILTRADNTAVLDITLIKQFECIAEFAGIELHNTKDTFDQRTILYGILRTDIKPTEVQYHHSQMCDQRLFAEALRMFGDTDSLQKIIESHPNISFS